MKGDKRSIGWSHIITNSNTWRSYLGFFTWVGSNYCRYLSKGVTWQKFFALGRFILTGICIGRKRRMQVGKPISRLLVCYCNIHERLWDLIQNTRREKWWEKCYGGHTEGVYRILLVGRKRKRTSCQTWSLGEHWCY